MDDPANSQNQPSDVTLKPVVEEVAPPLPDSSPFANTPTPPTTTPLTPSNESILTPNATPTTPASPIPNQPSRKFKVNKKVVAGLISILFLTVGAIAGVYTVLNNRQAEKSLAAGNYCDISSNCCTADADTTYGSQHCWLEVHHCDSNTIAPCIVPSPEIYEDSYCANPSCGTIQVDLICDSGDSGLATLVHAATSCDTSGGTVPPPDGTNPTPDSSLAICGESCQQDSDCTPSTHPSVDSVVCREGQCVNQECYDSGGQTVPGTLCLCQNAGQCGAECGADIGLCDDGFSCTYRAQSECNPINHGVCVPADMTTVPEYDGSLFERVQCGPTTQDGYNNYIYHPSFPDHVFTDEEVLGLICNPIPSPTATPTIPPTSDLSAICTDIRAYDTDWNLLTINELSSLTPGSQVYFTTRGQIADTLTGTQQIQKARFSINNQSAIETTETKPNSTQEFSLLYTIPEFSTGSQTFTISAELFYPDIGWF